MYAAVNFRVPHIFFLWFYFMELNIYVSCEYTRMEKSRQMSGQYSTVSKINGNDKPKPNRCQHFN